MNLPVLCSEVFPKFLIFSANVTPLIYYSHISVLFVALIAAIFILLKGRKELLNQVFFFTLLPFIVWVFLDSVFWATNRSDIIMFAWAIVILVEPLVYIGSFYLIYIMVYQKDMSYALKLAIFLIYLPIIIFSPTAYFLSSYDASTCLSTETNFSFYTYVIELFFTFLILILVIKKYIQSNDTLFKKQIKYITAGIILFLLAFSWGNIISSFTDNWQISQIGLFALPVFIGFLVYSIVQFQTFNIKLIATQALVWGLVILIGSQFLFIQNPTNRILNSVTFVGVIIFGYLLTKSVKREIEQRERIEKLNVDLQESIKQRESLVHLVTHKVKGSFTRTKFIFAGLLDGTFGKISPEVEKVAQQGFDFDQGGLETVDLVLNVANLEKGLIKYDMKPVDFREILEKTLEEKKGQIEAKGLKLETNINPEGNYKVMGDAIWLKEVVNNLLENSTKYTRTGAISVNLADGNGKILLSVKDTGIGITAEDEKNLFTEGGRGKESIKVNVDSTGYGLYSVKLIVDAHKGKVWEHSEGLNKGSQFFVELPAIS